MSFVDKNSDDIFDVDFSELDEKGSEEKDIPVQSQDSKSKKQSQEKQGNQEENAIQESNNADVSEIEELDILDDSLKDLPGVSTGKIGVKVSRFLVERCRFTTSKKERLSIIKDDVIPVKLHYDEDTGSFICFEGKCCEMLGFPRVKYVYPVVFYDTDTKGKIQSKDIQVKVLSVGNEQNEDLITINEVQGDITGFDLLVSCKDEQYQKISFTVAGKAAWRTRPEMVQFVKNFLTRNKKHLLTAVGKKLNESEFLKLMGYSESEQENLDFDDVFPDD